MTIITGFSFKYDGERIYDTNISSYNSHSPVNGTDVLPYHGPIEISPEVSIIGDRLYSVVTGLRPEQEGGGGLGEGATVWCGDPSGTGELKVNPTDWPFARIEMEISSCDIYMYSYPDEEDNSDYRVYDYYNATVRWHYLYQHGITNNPGVGQVRPRYIWENHTSQHLGYRQISKKQSIDYPNPELFLSFDAEDLYGAGLMNSWESVIRNPRCIPYTDDPPPSFIGSDEYDIKPEENLPDGDNYFTGSENWIAISGVIVNEYWGGIFYRFLHEIDGVASASASPPILQDDSHPESGGRDYTKLSFAWGGSVIFPLQWTTDDGSALKMNQRDDGRGAISGPGRIGYYGFNGGHSSRLAGGAW